MDRATTLPQGPGAFCGYTYCGELGAADAGRTIRRVVVSDDDYRASLIARGTPEGAVPMILGIFQAARRGDFAPADPTLSRLLGRPPLALREYLRSTLAAG